MLSKLQAKLKEKNMGAYVLCAFENYVYLSGFSGSNCYLVVTETEGYLITDSRYSVYAKEFSDKFNVIIYERSPFEEIGKLGFDTLYFENTMSVKEMGELSKYVNDLIPSEDLVLPLRMVKEPWELVHIKDAIHINYAVLAEIQNHITPGITERELYRKLVCLLYEAGSEGLAFSPIVAFGERSAICHAEPTDRVLTKNEPVLLDFGAVSGGYCGDITRTFFYGEPKGQMAELYALVERAKEIGEEHAVAGALAKDVHNAVVSFFAEYKMESYFLHSLGHGVGLKVHELPNLSPRSDVVLEKNMVVTVEPGLYMEGIGGVRLEDIKIIL